MKPYLYQFAALLNTNDVSFTGPKSDTGIIKNILMPVYFWGGVIAIIVILVAGYLFVTSNGNPQQVTRARNAVIGAAVGLIVILSAFTITNIVLGGF
ncbi:hypothetical protein IPM09_04745 [Candidatus Saccharibacteria bacterium]|nr:MAG: hypothetical protein IPM09_04745 [Candidatus Saccharibacteria bacterium]